MACTVRLSATRHANVCEGSPVVRTRERGAGRRLAIVIFQQENDKGAKNFCFGLAEKASIYGREYRDYRRETSYRD